MGTPVEMPKLGNTVEDCLLSKWMKRKGDAVAAGDVIAEIETDKATFEVAAPAGGVLLETFFEEGSLVPVFANICAIGERGESVAEFAPKAAVGQTIAFGGLPTAVTAEPVMTETPEQAFVSPRARRFAAEHSMSTAGVRGSGPSGRILEQDLRDVFYSSP